jgi:leucyl-tRNA synthetase
MQAYDHKKLEKKWQTVWDKKKAYKTLNPSTRSGQVNKKKYYVLDMFPYPSGVGLHVGHPKGYIGSDIFARMKRMAGFNVLHPMGYDAFGLPAEQYAIEHNINPAQAVAKNVKTFEGQLSKIGLSYDWDRRVNTTDPNFYKWTQWIFLKIYDSWYNPETNKAEPIKNLIKKFEKSDPSWKKKSAKEKQDILMQYRLAYEGYSEVNWCPKLGTVLANDEIVDGKAGPVSERGGYPVVKKNMRQWFMRITAYADRLLAGLEGLNWSTHIKEIQKNWIGKSEGLIFSAKVKDSDIVIKTFSAHFEACYADTFFVIAPDHPLLPKLLEGRKEKDAVLKKAQEIVAKREKLGDKSEDQNKEIDGIFTGRYAIDPLGNGDLPIWVASFALKDYGTGIVKCSAHDERDFAFAKKFNIRLKEVIEPLFIDTSVTDRVRSDRPMVEREAILAIVKHWSEDKYLGLKWKKIGWGTFISGGVEKGQTPEQAARAEIEEETGYFNLKLIKTLGRYHSKFFHTPKNENRFGHFNCFYFQLENGEQKEILQEEKDKHEMVWLTKDEVEKFITPDSVRYRWNVLQGIQKPILSGILTEPSEFKGREIHEARNDIANWLVKKGFAERKVNYKMRDAVFARQRYWGEPIPLMHDKEGIISELPEKKLPLKLPLVKSYQPTGTGESPLASVKDWVKHGYETNTMPGWAGSSWYFLRYMDPKNKKAFADKGAIKYWKNVDMYVGGQEHATGHLLYSRFWHKFLKDYGLVVTEEPFQTLRNQGMIAGTDGRKMSKRWGNVINPDDIIKTYGADTLRVYEMFMGPFDASLPWSTDNIVGSRRFLERIWKMGKKVLEQKNSAALPASGLRHGQNFSVPKLLHKTIKKVSEDIETFSFNTCISSMMILLNEMEKEFQGKTLNPQKGLALEDFELFLKILSPFAPHITEEIWSSFGHKNLLMLEKWPKADSKKMIESEIKIVIQINGKVRAELIINTDEKEESVKEKALKNETVLKYTNGQNIKKVIYVKNRLINIVL